MGDSVKTKEKKKNEEKEKRNNEIKKFKHFVKYAPTAYQKACNYDVLCTYLSYTKNYHPGMNLVDKIKSVKTQSVRKLFYQDTIDRFKEVTRPFTNLNFYEGMNWDNFYSKEELLNLVSNFLMINSPELYRYFNRIKDIWIVYGKLNNSPCMTKLFFANGMCMPYIFMNKFNSLRDAINLVHELGHAYYCYYNYNYNKNYKEPEDGIDILDEEVKKEIVPCTLERLFLSHLGTDRGWIPQSYAGYMNNVLIETSRNVQISNEKNILYNASYALGELYGKQISHNLIFYDKGININKLCDFVLTNNIFQIIRQINISPFLINVINHENTKRPGKEYQEANRMQNIEPNVLVKKEKTRKKQKVRN